MDDSGNDRQQQIDDTMASLTDKLEDLGDQVSGTVKTVKDSIGSVRDTFDVKLQVRQHPFTALAGAAALGFFGGFRPGGKPTQNNKSSAGPEPHAAPSQGAHAEANGDTKGAHDGRSPAAAPKNWSTHLEDAIRPQISTLRGVAVGTLLQVVREVIRKEAAKPQAQSKGDAHTLSNGPMQDQSRAS